MPRMMLSFSGTVGDMRHWMATLLIVHADVQGLLGQPVDVNALDARLARLGAPPVHEALELLYRGENWR